MPEMNVVVVLGGVVEQSCILAERLTNNFLKI
jgi:hypothetical protein